MALALILLPIAFALLAALIPSNRLRPLLLPVAATVHLALTALVVARPELSSSIVPGAAGAGEDSPLGLDAPGKLVLLSVSVLYFFCSVYSVGYLRYREERSNRVFVSCLLVFLGVASLVAWSQHLGLMWVAIEATTLSTAPLIYFNRTKRSIEATWKYLLVGSVGIALALLGTFFLAYSAVPAGLEPSMTLRALLSSAPGLSKGWLRAAFVLLLVGYGTKMGLAPMHTWKPDAYGEAPGVVGAVFAGGVTSVAFLALMRVYRVCAAAGEAGYASSLLVPMGLVSMAVAGLFMVGQRDFKRSLAYSSVEHMGILALGLGMGGGALFGTMLHIATNSMTKGVLFLSAGNIHRAYASKSTDEVRGALRRLPVSGALFLAGFLAITGSPPFGPFASEFSILIGTFDAGRYAVVALYLAFLLLVFIGMGRTTLKVELGRPPAIAQAEAEGRPYRDGFLTVAPVVALMAIVLLLGLWLPGPIEALVRDAAACMGAVR
jgi:hydrogenase-4 component F